MPGKCEYPDNWQEIATAVKQAMGYRCERCGLRCLPLGKSYRHLPLSIRRQLSALLGETHAQGVRTRDFIRKFTTTPAVKVVRFGSQAVTLSVDRRPAGGNRSRSFQNRWRSVELDIAQFSNPPSCM